MLLSTEVHCLNDMTVILLKDNRSIAVSTGVSCNKTVTHIVK